MLSDHAAASYFGRILASVQDRYILAIDLADGETAYHPSFGGEPMSIGAVINIMNDRRVTALIIE